MRVLLSTQSSVRACAVTGYERCGAGAGLYDESAIRGRHLAASGQNVRKDFSDGL